MCGIAAASLAATVIGGVVTAVGGLRRAQAGADQSRYNAAIARNNQARAEVLAQDEEERGRAEEREQRIRGRQLVGQMRAALASSGQVVDQGSALELVLDQEEVNELDALTTRTNAQRRAAELRARGVEFGTEADLLDISADRGEITGTLAATGSLLGTAGTVARRWYDFRREGAFGGSS